MKQATNISSMVNIWPSHSGKYPLMDIMSVIYSNNISQQKLKLPFLEEEEELVLLQYKQW